MVKAKVIKRFRDKESNQVFEAKAIFESDEKRINYLQQRGYIGEVVTIDERLEGNVDEVKLAFDGLGQEDLEKLLKEEQENKNRKGIVQHIEQLLSDFKEGD